VDVSGCADEDDDDYPTPEVLDHGVPLRVQPELHLGQEAEGDGEFVDVELIGVVLEGVDHRGGLEDVVTNRVLPYQALVGLAGEEEAQYLQGKAGN